MRRRLLAQSRGLVFAPLIVLALALPLGALVLAAPVNGTPRVSLGTPSHYLPLFAKNSEGWDSILYVQNMAVGDTILSVQFRGTPEVVLSYVLAGKSTLTLRARDVTGLPASWTGGVLVYSDNWVETLVYMTRSQGTLFSGYRGIEWGSLSLAYLGPLWNDSSRTSSLTVLNMARNEGSVASMIEAKFFSFAGTTVNTQTVSIPPTSTVTFNTPPGGPYWARVEAPDTSVYGVVSTFDTAGTLVNVEGTLAGGTDVYLPRAIKGVDRGGGARTTTLFVGNTDATVVSPTLRYYNPTGAVAASTPFTLPLRGATRIDLASDTNLAGSGGWAVGVGSVNMVFGEETAYTPPPANYRAGGYGTYADGMHGLPRLVRSDLVNSVITILNVGESSETADVRFYSSGGTLVHSTNANLDAKGWVTLDLRAITQLGSNFRGSASVDAATGMNALKVWVDEHN